MRTFKSSDFLVSNVFGAMLGGGLAGILMLVVMAVVVSGNPSAGNIRFALGLGFILIIASVCLIPGNLIAVYPYAVSVVEGKNLQLHAPLKRLQIPIEDLEDMRQSSLQPGYIVRLRRRHRLLKSFVIPLWFGAETESVVEAIREEIRRGPLP